MYTYQFAPPLPPHHHQSCRSKEICEHSHLGEGYNTVRKSWSKRESAGYLVHDSHDVSQLGLSAVIGTG